MYDTNATISKEGGDSYLYLLGNVLQKLANGHGFPFIIRNNM